MRAYLIGVTGNSFIRISRTSIGCKTNSRRSQYAYVCDPYRRGGCQVSCNPQDVAVIKPQISAGSQEIPAGLPVYRHMELDGERGLFVNNAGAKH